MNQSASQGSSLRLGVPLGIVSVLTLVRYGVPVIAPDSVPVAVMAGPLGLLALLGWWTFASGRPWGERLLLTGGVLAILVAGALLLDPSIAQGMMGLLYPVYATPLAGIALGLGWVLTARAGQGPRLAVVFGLIALVSGSFSLLRTGGLSGDFDQDFAWRWSATSEERFLASLEEQQEPAEQGLEEAAGAEEAALLDLSWTDFRGPNRDSVAHGVALDPDWESAPPELLWRQAVGPAWSSFVVGGGHLFTQEQRGEEEVVAAYRLDTGDSVWVHAVPTRFWESVSGPGPRGTPTLAGSEVFALGATGMLRALQALDGSELWVRDAGEDAGVPAPDWGFASSPLVLEDAVLVGLAGTLLAYDRSSGELRWKTEANEKGYSSAQYSERCGVPQILFHSGAGVSGLRPEDGGVLWHYAWEGDPILQPAVVGESDLILSADATSGMRRIALQLQDDVWSVEETWVSRRMKPYYADFVVHDGHAYGFDGSLLACLDISEGKRVWKGGRYGRGQVLLLPEQDQLLVLGEQGELVLVEAKPEAFRELATWPALTGKTWNHPVLVGDLLLVRNAEEMAAFRMALSSKEGAQ